MDKAVEAALIAQTKFFNNVDGVEAGIAWPDSYDSAGQAIKRGAMRAALTAADEARAVGDEELAAALIGSDGKSVAQAIREQLNAAGMKVVWR